MIFVAIGALRVNVTLSCYVTFQRTQDGFSWRLFIIKNAELNGEQKNPLFL